MDDHLRYISVAALIVSKDRNHFLLGVRGDGDAFKPGSVVFPSGRLEGDETMRKRIFAEIAEEVGIPVDEGSLTYIGECVFKRQEIPVNQLCFAVVATDDTIAPRSTELNTIKWMTVADFKNAHACQGYVAELHGFVEETVRRGLLNNHTSA